MPSQNHHRLHLHMLDVDHQDYEPDDCQQLEMRVYWDKRSRLRKQANPREQLVPSMRHLRNPDGLQGWTP